MPIMDSARWFLSHLLKLGSMSNIKLKVMAGSSSQKEMGFILQRRDHTLRVLPLQRDIDALERKLLEVEMEKDS